MAWLALQGVLNQLAITTDLAPVGAANAWAGSTGLSLIGALNTEAGNARAPSVIRSIAEMFLEPLTVMADPGIGGIRLNNSDPALATAIAINKIDRNGVPIAAPGNLTTGDRLTVDNDPNNLASYLLSGVVVDNGAWWEIPITNDIIRGTLGYSKPANVRSIEANPGGGWVGLRAVCNQLATLTSPNDLDPVGALNTLAGNARS